MMEFHAGRSSDCFFYVPMRRVCYHRLMIDP